MCNNKSGNAEHLIRLAELQRGRFLARSQIEWKMAVGLWSAMGLAVYVIFANHLILTRPQYYVIVATLGLASVAYLAFLLAVTASHRKDLDWLQYYRDCAACILDIHVPMPTLPEDMKATPLQYMWKHKKRLLWSYLPQACLTLLFVISVACLLYPGTCRHSEASRHSDTQVITCADPASPQAGH